MFRPTFVVLFTALFLSLSGTAPAAPDATRPLRILVLASSPTYCDLFAGGAGAAWAEQGHEVRFAYVRLGEAERDPDGGLRMRRGLEAAEAGRALGVDYRVIDDPSGESLFGDRLRRRLAEEFRDFAPDVVIAPDPARSALGVAVRDALGATRLTHPPAIMFFLDSARAGASADLVVPIGAQLGQKRLALGAHRATPYVFEPTVHSGGAASIAVKRAVPPPPMSQAQRDATTEAFVFANGAGPDAATRARLSVDPAPR